MKKENEYGGNDNKVEKENLMIEIMDPWWESRICWFELNTLDLAASIVFTRFALCALSCPRLQTSAGTLA